MSERMCVKCGGKHEPCWLGVFYCEKYLSAGTREATVDELRSRGLEHESYWLPERAHG